VWRNEMIHRFPPATRTAHRLSDTGPECAGL
jgi:hypothetical protein